MTNTPFPLLPGVYKDDTPLKREGQVLDSQWMRWDLDSWETMGGYEVATSATFAGIARGGHAWADINGTRAAGFGTAAKLYAYYGGDIRDITPLKAKGTLVNAFQTQTGSPVVLVASLAHGLKSGDIVTFTNADPVGGITVNGAYPVDVLTGNIYRITAGTNATSDASGGGNVEFSVPLDVGLVDGIGGLGYGSGAYGSGFYGVSTSGDIHARVWSLDNFGNNLLAVPTNGALYEWQPQPAYPELVVNGSFATTANWFTNIATLNNPFTTTNASATVTVAHTAHGMLTGDKITFRNATPVGGVLINGEKTITVVNANSYTVVGPNNATSAVAGGGGLVEIEQSKTGGGSNGWSISGGKANATAGRASSIYQDMTGVLSGGVTYSITFDAVVTAGSFQFRVTDSSSDTPFPVALGQAITKSATYTRRFTAPANPTYAQFAKDASFAGSIDNVSIKVESSAYRIQDAPQYSRDMFVDPSGFVVLLGTVMLDGSFNSMGIRWSDAKNNRTWTPNDDVQAGFNVLSVGSEIRGGIATRGQNLIWTDSALYSMRFTGAAEVFRFDLIGSNAGLIHKNAMIEHLGIAFWWGPDKNFHIYTGGAPQILECTVRDDVMSNLAPGQESKITCGVNSAFNEVWWIYPDQRDGAGGTGGIECSRYVVFNWSKNIWYVGMLPRTQWIGDGVFPTPIALAPDGRIYFQELGKTANGDTLKASLGPVELDIGEGDFLMRVKRFVADFRQQQGVVKLTPSFRSFPQAVPKSYGPYESRTTTLKIDFRHTGRVMGLLFDMEGAPLNVRFGRLEVDIDATSSIR